MLPCFVFACRGRVPHPEHFRFKSKDFPLLLQALFNSNSHGDGHTDHGVVTSVPETPGSPKGLPKVENSLRNNSFRKQSESLFYSPFWPMFNFVRTSRRQKSFVLGWFYYIRNKKFCKSFFLGCACISLSLLCSSLPKRTMLS